MADPSQRLMNRNYEEFSKTVDRNKKRTFIGSKVLAHFVVATAVCPFKVLGMSLQLSVAPNKAFYESTSFEVSRLEIAKSHELAVKERSLNSLQMISGVTGSNMPFRAPIYAGYRDAFLGLAGQGYQGFFKGNVAHALHYGLAIQALTWNTSILSVDSLPRGPNFLLTSAIFLGTAVLVQPFKTIHTRFVLQNRIPSFATYKSLYNIFTRVRFPELYQGYTVVLPYTCAYTVAFSTVMAGFGPAYVSLASFLAYALTYPLSTVQVRLEAQSREHTMLPRRYIGWRYALSKVYHEEGLWKGLYRGFLANSIAHTVTTTYSAYLAINLFRTLEYHQFKSEGLDLVN